VGSTKVQVLLAMPVSNIVPFMSMFCRLLGAWWNQNIQLQQKGGQYHWSVHLGHSCFGGKVELAAV